MLRVFKPELTERIDSGTGRIVRQLTDTHCISHHPFFLIPAYDNAMQWLFFVSHRLGTPQIFGIERDTFKIVQFTDIQDLNEWSVHPDLSGAFVYFTTKTGGWRLELQTATIENLFEYGKGAATAAGMVAGGMGTTALSPHGIFWAYPFNTAEGVHIMKCDTRDGTISEITTHDAVAHMQFCPNDDSLLYFAGNFTERLWTVKVDGTEKTKHGKREIGQWITHESWVPNRRELMYVDWPHAVRAVSIDDGAIRSIAAINAWHAICDPSGKYVVADTNCPDIGLQIFNTAGEQAPRTLCFPQATNAGAHWKDPFPYEDGPIKVYAPQHTHPHPRFSPDRSKIVFTSDRTGYPQLYEFDTADLEI
jgi:oligogalacturonide lyase